MFKSVTPAKWLFLYREHYVRIGAQRFYRTVVSASEEFAAFEAASTAMNTVPHYKHERIFVYIPTGSRDQIKAWRKKHDRPGEAETIRWLLALGLQARK